MVSVGRGSVFSQLPWVGYLVIFSSSISIIIFASLCAFCCKWKRIPQHDSDEDEEGERSHCSGHSHSGHSHIQVAPTSTHHVQPPEKQTPSFLNRPSNTLCQFQHENIQPAYEDFMAHEYIRTGAVTFPSVIPDAPTEHTENLGVIYFSISYDVFTQMFKVLIKKAEGLPKMDLFGTSDPYVKIYLLPDKKHTLETRVRKRKLNPMWNEVFTFTDFPHEKLMEKKLVLQVYDYDRFSKDDEIGEVILPLKNVPLQNEAVEFKTELSPSKHSSGWLGDLLLSICYKPNDSRLTVIVMKCSKLKPMDVTGKSDPYVKLYLNCHGRRMAKRRTTVKSKSLDPVWNEVMVFEILFNKTRDMQCIFSVMDYNKRLPNKMIGQVVIGPRCAGTSVKHWADVMNSPRKPIAMWHRIVRY